MTLNVQFITLWFMFVSGMGLGMLYDAFRVVFVQLRLPRWTFPLADVVYWITATVCVFGTLVHSNQGQVRFFVFVGLIIGLLVYMMTLSRTVRKVIAVLIRAVKWLLRFFRRMFTLLFIKPAIGLYKLAWVLLGFLAALAMFLFRVVVQLVYPMWKLLLWLTRPLYKHLRVPARVLRWVNFLKQLFQKWFRKGK
ncbi:MULTISPECIES: spore cortex biosynthesis protein YabQ [unclassified Paenibacillus]|uniref:spore cortex biosynthesis protein YabQ n=1 Tax=unclassified Paenibacillus TaxID=185978 RepID=UPI00020D7D18|nr:MULTISPECIES: spore cortex biosynthesis protein YabQ [unclassified Paenibacillus]EGL19668.1 spore cortex biosynthesis protein YabQ [Paenibacillus sp. HGF7]EPD80415.1 spore cortex biosynthesis protein YabQ [Paenibacillus sp. HGH0039]